MSQQSGEIGLFLPTTEIFESQEVEELNNNLSNIINEHALAINQKDTGIYETDTGATGTPINFVCGQTYFPNPSPPTGVNPNARRQVFRKVVNFGALPNAATKSIAHRITTNETFTFTRIYGTATDPGASAITSAIPLPFSSPTLNQNISLTVDATNVNITTAIDYSAYTTTYIVLEWIAN